MPKRVTYRTTGDLTYRFGRLRRAAREWLDGLARRRTPAIHVFPGSQAGGSLPPRGRLGFFPGSFDPPTRAHEAIVRTALRTARFRRVVITLDLESETIDKPSHAASLADRIALACIAFRKEPRVAVAVATHGRFLEKATAIRRAGLSGQEVHYIAGADTLERAFAGRYYDHPRREIPRLQRIARFHVFPREGSESPSSGPPGVRLLPLRRSLRRISSTGVRRALARGEAPLDDATAEVLLCVRSAGLYERRGRPEYAIVTSFLRRRGRVLILKRSGRVGSFQSSWAGVSGYLDWPLARAADVVRGSISRAELRRRSLEQAYTEIREETGLRRSDLKLRARHEPIRFPEKGARRVWVVSPFLFDVRRGARIRLDWEHEEARWLWPHQLRDHPIVPGLDRSLASVLGIPRRPADDRGFGERATGIARDPLGGALEILRDALALLDEFVELGPEGAEAARDELDEVRRALLSGHGMAPLIHLGERWLPAVIRRKGPPKRVLRSSLAALRRSADESERRARRAAVEALRGKRAIATYSYSSAVLGALGAVRRRRIAEVSVVRDPLDHCDRLARRLRRQGRGRVQLVPRLPDDSEALVLGCDVIYGRSAFANAPGSSRLAEEARRRGLPVIVVGHPLKRLPGPAPRRLSDPVLEMVHARGVTIVGA